MKQNYKFTIAYDGSRYYGWEHQPNTELTVQGQLEIAMKALTGEFVEIIGAGRTDAGVHAKGMVANARITTRLSDLKIRDFLNQKLPEDIRILDVRRAAEGFHSRYKAVGKTYCYTCYTGSLKPVFRRKYVHILEEKPEIERMKRAAAHLIGSHDFASFCANPEEMKSTVRIVDWIRIEEEGDYLSMTFHGTGFLQYMVRILSGTLIEVGLGRRDPDSIPELIRAKDRTKAGFTAPAKGLTMIKVDYN
ncbi:MAG: tRNA pseudouridine(38-40) synthase TruA [Dorea sp.]|nr:tRNA pseudouridine(38-40) synthase TruA [Dorea sp.]